MRPYPTLAGARILLTGATGGLGSPLAGNLVREGADVFLNAHPGHDLENLETELSALKGGGRIASLASDVSDDRCRHDLIALALECLGGIDILINNAGIETTKRLDLVEADEVLRILRVNLEGPVMLSRLVLPHMLARGRGQIVNISSLAGKCGPALQEPYAASKAGLVGFTQSLRASYGALGIGATVICPGFVDAGIYRRMVEQTGVEAPPLVGTMPVDKFCRAVLEAIRRNKPEVVVSGRPVKPLLVAMAISSRLGEWMASKTGGHQFFRRVNEILRAAADQSDG